MSNPKLALIPSGYKSGKVYSILPNNATGDFDFTRQSIGTRVRKDGLIEEAKTVGSITNLQIRSEEFDNSAWIKSDISVTANDTLAPNGTNTADAIVEGTGTGGKIIYDTYTTSADVYTFSVHIKKEDKRYTSLQVSGTAFGMFNVDLDNGTGEVVSGSFDETNIETLANDWYRVSVTFTATSGTLNTQIYLMSGSAYANRNYTGNGTDKNYIWGAMVSEGALSDYIKTEGSSETKTVETFTDVPRLDWLNSNCPSLLLEPQRTNAFTYSEQFNQSVWFKSSCTITTNQIIAPDGKLTADLATSTGSGGGVYRFSSWNTTEKTASIFVKKNTSSTVEIFNASAATNRVVFDLDSGTITTEGGTMTGTIQDFDNDWYRLTATHTATAGQTFGIKPETSKSVYIWGAQIEDASYSSSYIKTEASTVTRLKDECTNGGDSDLFNITEGTFFVDTTPFTREATDRITLSDNSYNNRILISKSSSTQLQFIIVSNNSTSATYTTNINYNQRNKIAFTFKQNEFKFYLNGSLVHTDTSGSVPTGLNDLSFKGIGSALYWNGKIHDTRVYDRVLTQTEVEELTTL